jgi:hypothetical protein
VHNSKLTSPKELGHEIEGSVSLPADIFAAVCRSVVPCCEYCLNDNNGFINFSFIHLHSKYLKLYDFDN